MAKAPPIVVVVEPSVAVTGAFIALRHAAALLQGTVRIVLLLPQHTTLTATDLHDFWRVEYLPMAIPSKTPHALMNFLPRLLRGGWRIRQLLRSTGCSHVLLNDFYLSHGMVLRALGYRGFIGTFVRCNPTLIFGTLSGPLLWLSAISATRLIAVSRHIQSLLSPRYTCELLYDFYVAPDIAPARPDAIHPPRVFFYVGNYIAGKGQDMALRAFARAFGPREDVHLTFHGGTMGLHKNEQYRAQLVAMATQLGIASRVTFGGFVPDTAPLLATGFAALNFSGSESFSMTVLEACGMGLPVIATRSGGPQEIITDGVTGYLIPIGDEEAAARHMRQLADDPALAQRMGTAAAAHVRTHFSATTYRDRLLRILGIE